MLVLSPTSSILIGCGFELTIPESIAWGLTGQLVIPVLLVITPTKAQIFKEPLQRARGNADQRLLSAQRHPQTGKLHAAPAFFDQMQQKHRLQLCLYLGKRFGRAEEFCFFSKRDIAVFGEGGDYDLIV